MPSMQALTRGEAGGDTSSNAAHVFAALPSRCEAEVGEPPFISQAVAPLTVAAKTTCTEHEAGIAGNSRAFPTAAATVVSVTEWTTTSESGAGGGDAFRGAAPATAAMSSASVSARCETDADRNPRALSAAEGTPTAARREEVDRGTTAGESILLNWRTAVSNDEPAGLEVGFHPVPSAEGRRTKEPVGSREAVLEVFRHFRDVHEHTTTRAEMYGMLGSFGLFPEPGPALDAVWPALDSIDGKARIIDFVNAVFDKASRERERLGLSDLDAT